MVCKQKKVLKRKSGEELFDEIVIGNETVLRKYKERIKGMFAENLIDTNPDEQVEK